MAKTYKQIMDEARSTVPEVSADDVKARLDRKDPIALLDVREKDHDTGGRVGSRAPRPAAASCSR